MNYQTVNKTEETQELPVTYVKYKETEPGTVIAEGLYTGMWEGQGNFGPVTNFYVSLGDSKVCLPKAGNLGFLIEKAALVPNESKIRVTYLGMEKIRKGNFAGRDTHTFQLEVAE